MAMENASETATAASQPVVPQPVVPQPIVPIKIGSKQAQLNKALDSVEAVNNSGEGSVFLCTRN